MKAEQALAAQLRDGEKIMSSLEAAFRRQPSGLFKLPVEHDGKLALTTERIVFAGYDKKTKQPVTWGKALADVVSVEYRMMVVRVKTNEAIVLRYEFPVIAYDRGDPARAWVKLASGMCGGLTAAAPRKQDQTFTSPDQNAKLVALQHRFLNGELTATQFEAEKRSLLG